MGESIYDRYGFERISAVVHDFYGRVLRSEVTAPYFEGYDVPRIIHHQTQFLCQVMGGPTAYEGRDLFKAHHHMKISEEAFEEVADLLDETMEDHDVADADREAVMAIVSSARDQVIAP
jgi:hemoglobin